MQLGHVQWEICEQIMTKLLANQEQIVNNLWMAMDKSWKNNEKFMTNLKSYEQVRNKFWTNCEQAMSKLLDSCNQSYNKPY